MDRHLPELSATGSVAALLTASCCVLPMSMMLLGLGGSWLAVFGKIAALSLYVAVFSSITLAAAWIAAIRRRTSQKAYSILGVGTALTALAWIILLNETAINNYLITLM